MADQTIVQAVMLGVLEGLTEFIPVSSTGHILLAGHFLGFNSTGRTFEVLIQLGAILAILSVYAAKLWQIATRLPSDQQSRQFVIGVLLAFLPAAVVGALAYDFIKTILFESPLTICITLILGGFLLLWIERLPLKQKYDDVMDFPLGLCLKIGFFQCLAMVPGTSRSGATIAGALLMGTSKRAAAEFSFFLAMPTMLGAFVLDLSQNYDQLSANDVTVIVAGFIAAFFAAVIVVRFLLDYVSGHGFSIFAWWRIAVGTLGLIGLWILG